MALPNKETLEFYDKIFDWLTKKDRDNDNKIVYTFSKDVPKRNYRIILENQRQNRIANLRTILCRKLSTRRWVLF